jgi:hypothetical protein
MPIAAIRSDFPAAPCHTRIVFLQPKIFLRANPQRFAGCR